MTLGEVKQLELANSENVFPIDYDSAQYLVNLLNTNTFNCVLDLGCGATTRILSHYKTELNEKCEIFSIEDGIEYMDKISDITNVNKLLFESHYSANSTYYIGLNKHLKSLNKKFDLVIVDGPYSYGTKIARTNILDLIKIGLVDETTTILVHDAQREGERNLINSIMHLQPNRNIDVVGILGVIS